LDFLGEQIELIERDDVLQMPKDTDHENDSFEDIMIGEELNGDGGDRFSTFFGERHDEHEEHEEIGEEIDGEEQEEEISHENEDEEIREIHVEEIAPIDESQEIEADDPPQEPPLGNNNEE